MTRTQLRKDALAARMGKALLTWDDLRVLSTARQGAGWSAPTLTKFVGGTPGIGLYEFSAGTEQELSCTAQMPHGYKVGTSLYPHFHFSTKTTTATGVVQFGIEYTLGVLDVASPQAFSSVQTIYATYTFNANRQINHLLVAPPSPIAVPADFGLSSVMLCRIFRNTAVASNYADPISLIEFDIHVELDGIGSDLQYTKLDE